MRFVQQVQPLAGIRLSMPTSQQMPLSHGLQARQAEFLTQAPVISLTPLAVPACNRSLVVIDLDLHQPSG